MLLSPSCDDSNCVINGCVITYANLLMIARNTGTSVAMLDLFYARRLSAEMGKDVLTAKQDDDDD